MTKINNLNTIENIIDLMQADSDTWVWNTIANSGLYSIATAQLMITDIGSNRTLTQAQQDVMLSCEKQILENTDLASWAYPRSAGMPDNRRSTPESITSYVIGSRKNQETKDIDEALELMLSMEDDKAEIALLKKEANLEKQAVAMLCTDSEQQLITQLQQAVDGTPNMEFEISDRTAFFVIQSLYDIVARGSDKKLVMQRLRNTPAEYRADVVGNMKIYSSVLDKVKTIYTTYFHQAEAEGYAPANGIH